MSEEDNSNFLPFFWFSYLFNEQENPSKISNLIDINENGDKVTLIDKNSHQTFHCGNLIQKDFNSFIPQVKRGGGHLNIICGSGEYSKPPHFVDFLTASNYEDYEGANFQIPSSSFCTQNQDSKTPLINGVTNYIFDINQGVLGAVAAAPASIYRNYKCSTTTNLLSNFPFKTSNGYIKIDTEEINRFASLNFDWKNIENLCKIGIQRNNEVIIRRDPFDYHMFQIRSNPQNVHQIFCLRLNFLDDIIPCKFTKEIAQQILEAQYKMTIKAAWENSLLFPNNPGSRILFIVPLGYEFGTSLKIIANSIKACSELIADSGLDVYLSCPTHHCFEKCQRILQKVVDETNGKIILTTKVEINHLSELIETFSFMKVIKWVFIICIIFTLVLIFDKHYN